MILISLGVLEAARQDVTISRFDVGQTPVTEYAAPIYKFKTIYFNNLVM